MNFSLILLMSIVCSAMQSKLKTKSMTRQLTNNNNQTVIGNATTPVTTKPNFTSEHIPDTYAPVPLPPTVHPISGIIRTNNTFRNVPANLTGSLNGYEMPIPLPPTVHPGYIPGGRHRGMNGNNTLTNNTTSTNNTGITNGTSTTVPTYVPLSNAPAPPATVPLIPVTLTSLSGYSRNIPANFWVVAGNKTFIVLRNENDNYIICDRGTVSGVSHSGNMTEIPTSYLWELDFLNDTNTNLRSYDGNYLDYSNYKFNCSSTTSPSESYIIHKQSYLTGGATDNRTDYLTFQRGIFYLGIENGQVKLVEPDRSNSKFVPIFNRNIPNNPLPST